MKKIRLKILLGIITLSIVGIGMISCNEDRDENQKKEVTSFQTAEEIFFYSGFIKKTSNEKFTLACDYINEDGYQNHLERDFDSMSDACKHMQSCISQFPKTHWYNITINGESWDCPCLGINCDD